MLKDKNGNFSHTALYVLWTFVLCSVLMLDSLFNPALASSNTFWPSIVGLVGSALGAYVVRRGQDNNLPPPPPGV